MSKTYRRDKRDRDDDRDFRKERRKQKDETERPVSTIPEDYMSDGPWEVAVSRN